MNAWGECAEETRLMHEVLTEDTYKFDETRFAMGRYTVTLLAPTDF